jgi:hypothetical protein
MPSCWSCSWPDPRSPRQHRSLSHSETVTLPAERNGGGPGPKRTSAHTRRCGPRFQTHNNSRGGVSPPPW